ncbi:MAG: M23 family metallopeptidase [Pyrinomonadaceae bacterium]
MKQKDDRNYTFVVSRSNRNLIRVRRIGVTKRLTHISVGLVIFTGGVFSYNFIQKNIRPQIAQAYNQKANAQFLLAIPQNRIFGEGGPEMTELPAPNNELDTKIRNLEQSFRDSEHTPSIYPLIGKINDDFGSRRNPFGGSASEFHPGLDIDGEKGDVVIAPANGVVLKTGWTGGYGNMIEIDHGKGLTTRYGHLSQIDVEAGEEIERGQEIGKVGSTGRSTGPHLHYEVRIDGEAVSPHSFLPAGNSPVVQPQ